MWMLQVIQNANVLRKVANSTILSIATSLSPSLKILTLLLVDTIEYFV